MIEMLNATYDAEAVGQIKKVGESFTPSNELKSAYVPDHLRDKSYVVVGINPKTGGNWFVEIEYALELDNAQ